MCLVTQSCPTLRIPMGYSLPGSSVHGILQARIPERVTMPSSRGSSLLTDWTQVSHTAGRFFTIWTTREAPKLHVHRQKYFSPPLPWASLVAQLVKNSPAMRETWVRSLSWEDPLEKGRQPSLVFRPGEFHAGNVYGVAKSQTGLSDSHSLKDRTFWHIQA